MANLTRYNRRQSYQWNYAHAPSPVEREVPSWPGRWSYCGLPVASPLGIPAGPLLNGKWCLYYASLGFDVPTYKTVRSTARACYGPPNLQPVQCGQLFGGESGLPTADDAFDSWAVSFGMPSQSPEVWRADVEATRRALPPDKLLSVSVVGTVRDGWTIDQLANDYATCANWAVQSGADCVELNFSCPNVATCDGQLYQQPRDAQMVAEQTRGAIGKSPLIIKIGHLESDDEADLLVQALQDVAAALSTTNSVAATVQGSSGDLLFGGQRRGICGDAIRQASLAQVARLGRAVAHQGAKVSLIGVGGISSSDHCQQYLDAGAHAVQIATAAMINPEVAIRIKGTMSRRAGVAAPASRR